MVFDHTTGARVNVEKMNAVVRELGLSVLDEEQADSLPARSARRMSPRRGVARLLCDGCA